MAKSENNNENNQNESEDKGIQSSSVENEPSSHPLVAKLEQEIFNNPETIALSTGITVEYHLHGNPNAKEKVLLVMGLWTSKEAWFPTIDGILDRSPDSYQLVSFDNRGIGGSDAPSGRYTTSLLAQDAIALIDALGWDKVHLVGISMGGMIALETAIAIPERILSLSLLVTTTGFPSYLVAGPSQMTGVASMISTSMGTSATKIINQLLDILYTKEYLEQACQQDPNITNREFLFDFHLERSKTVKKPTREGAMGQFSAVLTHHVEKKRLNELRDIGFPILVVSALQDRLLHPHNSKKLYKRLKGDNTRTLILEEAGHGVIMQCKDKVTTELLKTFAMRKDEVVDTSF